MWRISARAEQPRRSAEAPRWSRRISARAEQPCPRTAWSPARGAHLRAGGAACPGQGTPPEPWGASPRGRSSPEREPERQSGARRISARAEQPPSAGRSCTTRRAHLRAGGAAAALHLPDDAAEGASPRGRSSPRLRRVAAGGSGRISARAEQPDIDFSIGETFTAHLRAGGAAASARVEYRNIAGASPRGRSSHLVVDQGLDGIRRISARAEQPDRRRQRARQSGAHLRAGGAASCSRGYLRTYPGASPRGRSSPGAHREVPAERRRISARAEQPTHEQHHYPHPEAHLRAGGAAYPTADGGASSPAHLRAGGAAVVSL